MAKSTKGFKESVGDFERISADIKARRYAPLYLLMGEESYFIDTICDMLAGDVLSEAEKAFNLTTIYGKDGDTGAIINLCRQVPMMGSLQVVIVREAQQLRKIEQLSLYTAAPSPSTILVLCHKEKGLDKRTQLYKHINAKGVVFESIRPRDYEIKGWLSDFIRRRGCSAEPKAVEMLTEHLGTDIAKISNELSKLLLSLPEGTKTITADHIEQNIGISKDFNLYELCKAVTTRDKARALMIADHFAANPKAYPLLVTVMALFGQFKEIFIINYYRWLVRFRGVQMPSDVEMCRILRVSSPFIVRELSQAATLYPNKKVFTILGLLREYDMKSKGMNTGGADDGELLRELLLKIFAL